MPENDAVLLERFFRGADAEAFSELVQRYVRLVYATSWRVLRHQTDAADVTQETFFELTRQAGRIAGPLAGWLHRVALQKSIDLIRRQSRRRRHERAYTRSRPVEVRTWHDLSGSVDEALEKLDESMRLLLLDRFLAGKTTTEIAHEHGISQATVSRRINEGLEQLRGMLRRQGLLVGFAALGTMLLESNAQAVPAAVAAGLSKMAMIGTTTSATAGLGGPAVVAAHAGAVKAALATATIAAAVSVIGYVHHVQKPAPPALPFAPAQTARPLAPGPGTNQPAPTSRVAATPDPPSFGEPVAAAVPPAAGQAPPEDPFLGPFGPAPEEGMRKRSFMVGDAFPGVPTTDLRTPEAAVYSFLTLLDQGAADQLRECFAEGVELPADSPYPRYLGYPVRLVEVVEEGDSARVSWEATAHRPFSYQGKDRVPGEFVPLVSRLVRVDGRWKILKLIE